MLLSIAVVAIKFVSEGLNLILVTVSTPHSNYCSGVDLSYDHSYTIAPAVANISSPYE